MNKVLLLFTVFLLAGCFEDRMPVEVGEVEGLKPIYVTEEGNVVEVQVAREFENLGKIVYAEPYLLINERFMGIHVVDNTNPADPIKLSFIQIPGNTDFTLKDGYLYANHGNDLKTFQITPGELSMALEVFNLQEVNSILNLFSDEAGLQVASLSPPNYEGFFECVETEKGIVVGWEETTLINPECRI